MYFFPFFCSDEGLKENLFVVYPPLDPKGEVLDAQSSFLIPAVSSPRPISRIR